MRRRRLLAAAATAVLAAAGPYLAWPARPADRISREGYAAVRLGMSEADVADAVGKRAGHYLTCEWAVLNDALRETEGPLAAAERAAPGELAWRSWTGDGGMVAVALDREGRVVVKTFVPVRERSDELVPRLRRWAGR